MDEKQTTQTEEVVATNENQDIQAETGIAELAGFIVTKEDVLQPVLLNQSNINDGTQYAQGFAYCAPPYYYLFRGTTMTVEFEQKLPGIYLTPDDHYIWIPVTPGNGDEDWKIEDKFAVTEMKQILQELMDREDISLAVPDSGKVFRPDELDSDDILKRAIKRALAMKRVDIDACRGRFSDKNALFNFKQVVKSPASRLSMLLFERGCTALNLRYTITVEEVDPDHPIGKALEKPIRICSEDTYSV